VRALLHGHDEALEQALRTRGLELVRDGEADVLVTLAPAPELWPLADLSPQAWLQRFRLGAAVHGPVLLIETERTVLVDTGLAHTPDEPLASAIAAAGAEPDLILITHADVDHCGGNRSMRELYPRAIFACPESDRRWVESNATMLAENYMWHAPYGLEQPDQQQLLTGLGGDAPIELGLRGGETIRLGRRRR
jgi:glyoxylase-like metal-dependent hydrolase (beta-lactamase superfamily II)